MLNMICNRNEKECTFFDFSYPNSINNLLWKSVTDEVRGGESVANISNKFVDVIYLIFMYFKT